MSATRRILVVEDEPAIADTITYALGTEGFETEHCLLGTEALARLRGEPYACVILDVGLPDLSGFDLCRELRTFSDVPVIFLTARSDEIDRVVGLELGGDDYVAKPFSPRELTARVRSILRRVDGRLASVPAQPASPAPFELEQQSGRIRYHGTALELTRYEYLLLKALVEEPERIFSRTELMQRVWTAPDHSVERTVDTHVKTLRAKLRAVRGGDSPIHTHRGLGYSLRAAP